MGQLGGVVRTLLPDPLTTPINWSPSDFPWEKSKCIYYFVHCTSDTFAFTFSLRVCAPTIGLFPGVQDQVTLSYLITIGLKTKVDSFLVCASKPNGRIFVSLCLKTDERMKMV
jgi:hypothetical protein